MTWIQSKTVQRFIPEYRKHLGVAAARIDIGIAASRGTPISPASIATIASRTHWPMRKRHKSWSRTRSKAGSIALIAATGKRAPGSCAFWWRKRIETI
jgi:hypothetical protein